MASEALDPEAALRDGFARLVAVPATFAAATLFVDLAAAFFAVTIECHADLRVRLGVVLAFGFTRRRLFFDAAVFFFADFASGA
jgi:hypothetical protein